MLEELPEEVFMQVLSDLLREDRLSVSITCKDLLKKVEVFCQRKWKEIGANADETWETRLRDTSLINANVPPELLPHRHLLSKAYQTPLFTFLGDPGEFFASIAVSKDGNHLMRASFSESGGLFEVFDLTLRKCIQKNSFTSNQDIRWISLLDCGRYAVVSDVENLCVYTIQGELLHTVSPQNGLGGRVRAIASSTNKLFLNYYEDGDAIACLDLVTGAVENRVISWARGRHAERFQMQVLGTMLILIRASIVGGHGRLAHDHEEGMFIFDLKDFSQKCCLRGKYDYFYVDCEHSNIVVVKPGKITDVFHLSRDGHLNQTGSFNLFSGRDILMVSQSRIYTCNVERSRGADSSKIEVFNTRNGKLLHAIKLSGFALCAITNGRELYIHFHLARGDGRPPIIRAYPLPE